MTILPEMNVTWVVSNDVGFRIVMRNTFNLEAVALAPVPTRINVNRLPWHTANRPQLRRLRAQQRVPPAVAAPPPPPPANDGNV